MRVERIKLTDKKQTADKMYWLVETYWPDLKKISVESEEGEKPILDLEPEQFFDLCKYIPYKRDVKPVEIIARPYYLFRFRNKGLDCKKKSVLMGSYFRGNGIPYRFLGVSTRKDGNIHHVFTQGKLSGKWYNFDCTYPEFEPYDIKTVTKAEIL